jgi:hypothetical protein
MGRSGDHNVLVLQSIGNGVALLPGWISATVGAINPAVLRGAAPLRIGGTRTLRCA